MHIRKNDGQAVIGKRDFSPVIADKLHVFRKINHFAILSLYHTKWIDARANIVEHRGK